jgi:hypothetical protein
VIAEDNMATGYAIACSGSKAEKPVIILQKNTVISNIQHVECGDNYGFGKHFRFVSNTFIRTGYDTRYRTIRLGWNGWKYESFEHLFIDTMFEGGAGYDSVSFDGAVSARYDFSVGWELRIRTAPGANVSIKGKTGAEVLSGTIPQEGEISVSLTQYVQELTGKTMLTPAHIVTVRCRGRTAARQVIMDKNRTIKRNYFLSGRNGPMRTLSSGSFASLRVHML